MALLSGCPHDPHSGGSTTAEPRREDLVGAWVPIAQTRRAVAEKGKYPPAETVVTLAADGSFRADNIPDWWNTSFGKPAGKFDSGSGKWSVRPQLHASPGPQGSWRVELHFDSTAEFHSAEPGPGLLKQALLVGYQPPYLLQFFVGDPDSGNAMNFERRPGL
jgi:hypothetical protein